MPPNGTPRKPLVAPPIGAQSTKGTVDIPRTSKTKSLDVAKGVGQEIIKVTKNGELEVKGTKFANISTLVKSLDKFPVEEQHDIQRAALLYVSTLQVQSTSPRDSQ